MPRLDEIIRQNFEASFAVREMRIGSFEQLAAATPTSTSEIIQVGQGRMRGRLKHATLAGLSLGFGSFSQGLISRGVYSKDWVTIGFLLDGRPSAAAIGRINNVRIWSRGAEHERRHTGRSSFGALSVSPEDLSNYFGPDSFFNDPMAWRAKSLFCLDAQRGAAAELALRNIMSAFEQRSSAITLAHAEFWKRAILEAATSAVPTVETSARFIPSPVRLVRRAQELIEEAGSTPIHISELTTALRIDRRTLQRAFQEVLGISPLDYLLHRRLCQARLFLRSSGSSNANVADVAFAYGFADFSRFAQYYRKLFEEYPSATLRAARAKV